MGSRNDFFTARAQLSPRQTYLDNASTSHPKAPGVIEAGTSVLTNHPGSPHRTSGESNADQIEHTREASARFIDAHDSKQVSFNSGATFALNSVIQGIARDGGHFLTTAFDHNSVLRPLEELRQTGAIDYSVAGVSPSGTLEVDTLLGELRSDTRLVILNHVSNVNGAVAPVVEVVSECNRRGILTLVDLSQSVGHRKLSVRELSCDFAAFSAHKGMLGFPGLGVLYVRDPQTLNPFVFGGDGRASLHLTHPRWAPAKYEGGTANTVAIAALDAAIDYLNQHDADDIAQHEQRWVSRVITGLATVPGVRILAGPSQASLFSFNLAGVSPTRTAHLLSSEFGVRTRAGLHCAPLAHQGLGSYPAGAVRVSPSLFSSAEDSDRIVDAVASLAKRLRTSP